MINIRSIFICTILAYSAASHAGPCKPQQRAHLDLWIRGGTVIDPRTEVVSQKDVGVKDGKIVDIRGLRSECITTKQVINAQGKWIMPSLQDLHVHNFGDQLPPTGNYDSPDYDKVTPEKMGQRMLYTGVTTYLDLFAPNDAIFDLRKRANNGELLNPRTYAAGPIFLVDNGHGVVNIPDMPKELRFVNTPEEAEQKITELIITRHPDIIKFVYNNNYIRFEPKYSDMPRAVARAIIQTAKKYGVKTTAHVVDWKHARDLVEEGIDSLAHMPADAIPADMPGLMAEKGVSVIATLCVYLDLAIIADKVTQPSILENWLLKLVATAGHIAAYVDPSKYDDGNKEWTNWAIQEFRDGPNQLKSAYLLHQNGVRLLLGTDSGVPGSFMGFSAHREMILMRMAGIEPMKVLKIGTSDSGDFMGLKVGFARGDIADLLVLNKNPLEKIDNTMEIDQLIFKGKVVDREKLERF